MNLETSRFGVIEVDEEKVIHMAGPILGFEGSRNYIILLHSEKTPFCWLQSLEESRVAFLILNPQTVKSDYEILLSDDDVQLLEIQKPEEVILMMIATIRSNPLMITANLRAPIVINATKRLAKQIVLENQDYPVQYPVLIKDGEKEKTAAEVLRANVLGISHAVAF